MLFCKEDIQAKNATRPALWQSIIRDDNKNRYVIEVDNKVVGFMHVDEPRDYFNDIDNSFYELHGIYLHPDYYRRGIGTKAMAFALDKARAMGKKIMILWVFIENYNSISFYKKCGFEVDGVTMVHAYGKEVVSGRMKRDLFK